MAIKTYNPTSPGMRFRTGLGFEEITKDKPEKSLVGPLKKSGGRNNTGRTLASGLLGTASFAIFMWALGRAPVGAVAALRETSVLFAAIIGTVVLGERATWKRYAAALLVIAGVVIVATARES